MGLGNVVRTIRFFGRIFNNMDITLNQNNISFDIMDNKLKTMIEGLRFSKIEKMLSEALDNLPNDNPVNYIGDLNRADIMH